MIKFALKCAEGHEFTSWFQSGEAYDALREAGHLSCAVCNCGDVEKSIMAPSIRPKTSAETTAGPLSQPASPAEQAIADLRRKIEADSDNVGPDFATEARRIHSGEVPSRPIYGEATLPDAKKLVDDGIPVAPLPWGNRKSN